MLRVSAMIEPSGNNGSPFGTVILNGVVPEFDPVQIVIDELSP